MSAVAPVELDLPAPPARRPSTPVRFALLLLAAFGTTVVLAVGFPAGAPDRLPVLLLAFALALDAAFRPSRAIRDFCFVFPLAGLVAGIFGSTDPIAWPIVLFGGLAVGWTFRFLYDFDSVPGTSQLDRPLSALVALWALGTFVALARARTLWALAHGLEGRAVNSQGLPETTAIRESLLTFAVLAAGAGLFFLLRRSGEAARGESMRAALIATAFSATAAVLQAIGILPAETRPFWRLTGRLSGGATDPNALGLLCGLAIPVLISLALRRPRPRWTLFALLPLPVGLALSGSRSGFLLAVLGSAVVLVLAPVERRMRTALAFVAVAVLAVFIGTLVRGSPGDVGERLGHLFRSSLSLEDRASSRPLLWRAALRLFSESPVEGGGVGSFAWRLPDVAGADRERLAMRDNPGSAYLQALAETGIAGLALTLLFVWALGRQAIARARERAATSAGAAAAVLSFLLVLVVGSHWLAPEVSFLFLLLAALAAAPGEGDGTPRNRAVARLSGVVLAVYAVFALIAIFGTLEPEETFENESLIGFHGQETGTGGPFRWTRRRFAIRAGPAAPERLSLANFSPEGKPVEVVVRTEGRTLYRRALPPGGGVTVALSSPRRPRVFEFELSRSFVPKRLVVSDDRRELGLLAVLPGDRNRAAGSN